MQDQPEAAFAGVVERNLAEPVAERAGQHHRAINGTKLPIAKPMKPKATTLEYARSASARRASPHGCSGWRGAGAVRRQRRADRYNHAATLGALMLISHTAKVAAFGFIGFAIGSFVPLMVAMVLAGALGTGSARLRSTTPAKAVSG